MASPKIRAIEVGGKNRYRFVVDIGIDPITGKRKQVTRTFDLRREAQAELAKILNEIQTGDYARPTKVTVEAYIDEWLRSATRGRERATVRNYEDAMRPVRERLGARQLQKLTTTDVEDLVDWQLTSGRRRGGTPGTGLSPRSVQLTLSRLKAALDAAVHRRLVPYNVAAPVKCPAQVQAIREPWVEDDIKGFLAALDERMRPIMMMSLIGLRPEEVCGLRWSDVDLDAGTLKVTNVRTLVATDHGLEVVEKGTKTTAGRRTLPLFEPLTSALRTLRVHQGAERLAAGPEAYEHTGYVLVDELGRPQRTDWLRRRFRKLSADAGLRRVRLYDARSAALTFLHREGVPLSVIAKWAGHADDGLTALKHYIRMNIEDLQVPAEAFAKLFG